MNSAWSSSADASWQYLAAQLAPYIKSLPVHPINNGSGIGVTHLGTHAFPMVRAVQWRTVEHMVQEKCTSWAIALSRQLLSMSEWDLQWHEPTTND